MSLSKTPKSLVRVLPFAFAAVLIACGEENATSPNGNTAAPKAPAPDGTPGVRKYSPDPPALDRIRSIDRHLIASLDYVNDALIPDYPTIERDTEGFRSRRDVPQNARALVTELPTASFEGRQVLHGSSRVRIDCYDDDTIDITVTEGPPPKEWYELVDGTRVDVLPTSTGGEEVPLAKLYHIEPDGEYTIQSLTPGVVYPRTTDSAAEILGTYVPWSLAGQVAAYPGATVERDMLGRILRASGTTARNMLVEVTCEDWQEMPIRHPRLLSLRERTPGGKVRKVKTLTLVSKNGA